MAKLSEESFKDFDRISTLENSSVDNKTLLLRVKIVEGVPVSSLEVQHDGDVLYEGIDLGKAVSCYNATEGSRKCDRKPLRKSDFYDYKNAHHLAYLDGKRLILVTTLEGVVDAPVSTFKVWRNKNLLFAGSGLKEAMWVLGV